MYILNTNIKLKLVNATIVSLFDYGDIEFKSFKMLTYMPFSTNVKRRKHVSITPYFGGFGWQKISIRWEINFLRFKKNNR